MPYDNEMELHYPEDAASFDVEITIVDPETGDHSSGVVDNLTTAMYFLVLNELKPIREGYQERGFINEAGEDDAAELVHRVWHESSVHKIMLTITVEGDPHLLQQL